MKHLYTILFISIVLGVADFSVVAQSGVSNKYGVPSGENHLVESHNESIEIVGKEGCIYIRTSRRVEVTVYTILGQKVMTRVVNPGVTELKMNTRGVYLVKVEGRTQKVAL